jgi:hypothetical protein
MESKPSIVLMLLSQNHDVFSVTWARLWEAMTRYLLRSTLELLCLVVVALYRYASVAFPTPQPGIMKKMLLARISK